MYCNCRLHDAAAGEQGSGSYSKRIHFQNLRCALLFSRHMHAQATKNMAALAADMRQLRSFLHVSTAYVNCFLGRQKHVEERQYAIMFNGKPMSHEAVIEELQSLPPKEAESRVRPVTRFMIAL